MERFKLNQVQYFDLVSYFMYKEAVIDLKSLIELSPTPQQDAIEIIDALMMEYVSRYKMVYNKYEKKAIDATGFDTSIPYISRLQYGTKEIGLYRKDEKFLDAYQTQKATITTKLTGTIYTSISRINLKYCIGYVIARRIIDGELNLTREQKEHYLRQYVIDLAKRMIRSHEVREEYGRYFNNEKCVVASVNIDTYYHSVEFALEYTPDFDLNDALIKSHVFEIQVPGTRRNSYLEHYIKFQDAMVNSYPEDYHFMSTGYLDDNLQPLTISMQVTNACNLRCSYCYQRDHGHEFMTIDVAKKAIDYFLTAALDEDIDKYINIKNNPSAIIEFVGGDGLMNIEVVDFSMTYMLQRMIDMNHPWLYKFGAYVSTNGVLYRTEKVQRVLERWNKLMGVTVTVDGNQELHDMCRKFPDGRGSYSYAADCFDDLLKKEYGPMSKLTLSPENIDYLVPSIIDFINRGHVHIWFNCINEHEWTDIEANKYFHYLIDIVDYLYDNDLITRIEVGVFGEKRFRPRVPGVDEHNFCGGNGHMLEVAPNGDFYNCSRFMEIALAGDRPPLDIGSIYRGIGNTEEDKAHITEMRNINRRSQSTDECYYCPVATNCGYCTAYNYEVFGTCDKRTTTVCKMHKANALANYYFMKKLSMKVKNLQSEEIPLTYDYVNTFISEQEYNDLLNS